MEFTQAVQTCFSKYADFTGRALRSEFWWFHLFLVAVRIVLYILTAISSAFAIIWIIFALAVLIPTLAVGARRLHDVGRSAWWLLLELTLIGVVLLIVWWALEGESGANAYGPAPKVSSAPPSMKRYS